MYVCVCGGGKFTWTNVVQEEKLLYEKNVTLWEQTWEKKSYKITRKTWKSVTGFSCFISQLGWKESDIHSCDESDHKKHY